METSAHPAVVCNRGIDCTSDKPGHKMTFMRSRMAHLHPAGWAAATVVGFDGDWALLSDLDTGQPLQVWNHEDLRVELNVHDLVAVHRACRTLAAGEARISVAMIAGAPSSL